jgi:signal transduction histidine kinase
LATLGTLAGSIAHEFNNLLTPVLSYAQMALASPDDHDLAKKALQKAVEGAERAAAAASSILGFIRDDDGQMVHVGHALKDALGCLARNPARDGIDLAVDIPEDAWVAISPVRLQQVLLNLLLNSRRAIMPRAGRITVKATCSTWNTPANATISSSDLVEIEFKDSGCGIPSELIDRVFEPFVRGPQPEGASRGTGLGLAICRQLITESHGLITIESALNQGTLVRITLPKADPAAAGGTGAQDSADRSTWNLRRSAQSRAA